jgi:heptosyltransferase-1
MPPSSVLIVKTSSLGDVVHALPALSDIRHHFPNTLVDWLVEESFSGIVKLHPSINRVITCEFRRWRKTFWQSPTRSAWRQFVALLDTTHYDAIVDLQGLVKSGFLSLQARGTRHGYDARSIREPLATHFYRHTYTVSRNLHAVERNRQLMAQALNYPLDTPANYGIIPPRNSDITLPAPTPYIMLLPATSRHEKYWAVDHWNSLIDWLLSRSVNIVILWGSESEHQFAKMLAAKNNERCIVPETRKDITTLAAWIGHASAVVGVDTGLMHLAAALSQFTIGIYGVTSPYLAGPYPASPERISLGGLDGFPSPKAVISALSRVIP